MSIILSIQSTLTNPTKARASQYWRVVTADRERLALSESRSARPSESRTRRKRMTADEKEKEEARVKAEEEKARQEHYKDFPKLPLLAATKWGRHLPRSTTSCAGAWCRTWTGK